MGHPPPPNLLKSHFPKGPEALESTQRRGVPNLLTGPAGSRHSLMDFCILSLRFPFSCLQLETFPFNLGNAPLFLLTAFKINVYCDAAFQTTLDFCVQVFGMFAAKKP